MQRASVGPDDSLQILIVDDNREIHQDLTALLATRREDDLDAAEEALFGESLHAAHGDGDEPNFELTSAFQGQDALERLKQAHQAGRPYSMAFVDMRMPPGWDGLETIERLWQVQPDLEVVICTAYSDHSWREVVRRLGHSDRFLVLKKPFDGIEARQLANSLAMKWRLRQWEQRQRQLLEEAVAERTKELSAARIAAESASRAKSAFLANMSHELRTPLTAVLGYAELLAESTLPDSDRAAHLAVIKNSAEHLLRIINQVLDLSKIEAGHLQMESVEASLPEILQGAARMLRTVAQEKSVPLTLHAATPIPERILTDPTRLSQIVINLLGNAVKFTDQGQVRLVASTVADEGGERLRIDVEDTGIGITDVQREQLFGAFTQVDMSVTRRHGGTGLGLSISRKLAQLLGGDVTLVRSEPNRGSTFRLEVPLRRGTDSRELSDLQDGPAAEQAAGAPALHRLQCRILLAEDSPDNQRLLATILRKAGADVTVAENGQLALELVDAAEHEGQPYDLLITDIQMPELDGFALAKELRGRGKTFPIVALTAHAMEEDRRRCFEAGCNDFASKPITRATLIGACAKWLPQAM